MFCTEIINGILVAEICVCPWCRQKFKKIASALPLMWLRSRWHGIVLTGEKGCDLSPREERREDICEHWDHFQCPLWFGLWWNDGQLCWTISSADVDLHQLYLEYKPQIWTFWCCKQTLVAQVVHCRCCFQGSIRYVNVWEWAEQTRIGVPAGRE